MIYDIVTAVMFVAFIVGISTLYMASKGWIPFPILPNREKSWNDARLKAEEEKWRIILAPFHGVGASYMPNTPMEVILYAQTKWQKPVIIRYGTTYLVIVRKTPKDEFLTIGFTDTLIPTFYFLEQLRWVEMEKVGRDSARKAIMKFRQTFTTRTFPGHLTDSPPIKLLKVMDMYEAYV